MGREFPPDTSVTVSRIIGASASRIGPGKATPRLQETASSVWHVIEGSGYSTIGDDKYRWEKGDTFCIPSWYPFQHYADAKDGGAPVYLYRYDDKPMLTSLGFYRTADMDVERLVST